MDKQTVKKYYIEYADTVMRAAWHYTGEMHAAQDCAEEAFLRLIQQEPMEDSKVFPWLLHTAVNIARDHHRRHEHSRTVSLYEANDMPSYDDDLICERAAKRAILSLPEKYRLVLFLYLVQGYSTEETARLIGKGENTTSSLIRRGRKMFEKAYEKECV